MSEARHVVVSGRVQGVGFRWSARETADALGITGWVRNRRDGRVEAHVEGPPQAVEEMVAWLAEGPSPARVAEVETAPARAEGHERFEVRR